MKANQFLLTTIAAGAIGALLVTLARSASLEQQMMHKSLQLPVEGKLPSFEGAIEWLNSQPLTASKLRGKVVLVEFWAYTCINWRAPSPMFAHGLKSTKIKDW